MKTAEIRLELQHLLSALCDGEMSDAEQARLEELLAGDQANRRIYLEYMDMHARLLSRPWIAGAIPGGEAPAPPSGAANACGAPQRQQPATLSIDSGPRGWIRKNLQQAVLVAGTLAASLLAQVYWQPPRPPETDAHQADVVALGNGQQKSGTPRTQNTVEYFATLQQAVDCEWDVPRSRLPIGTRLKSGELRMPKGVASILFDSGPELVVQGPAQLRLESDSTVTVLSGKAVLRAAESDALFDLRTPTAHSFVETGSEYAVAVSTDDEELQVFEGEVQRLPRSAGTRVEPEHLKAGDARRYQRDASLRGKPAPFDPKRFVRLVAAPTHPMPDPATGLIAYEGFDYRSPNTFVMGMGNGGFGWEGRWKTGFSHQFPENARPRTSLNIRDGLARDGGESIGGSFDYTGFASCKRKLAQPVRLDTDGVYYLSYLLRRRSPRDDPFSSVSVLLWTDADAESPSFEKHRSRLNIGVRGAGQLFAALERMDVRSSLAMTPDATYLLVAKIVASKVGADQVFLRLYGPDVPVPVTEPATWSVHSPPFQSNLVFDWMQLNIKGKTRQALDELRLGVTWSSVTSPWVDAN